MLFLKLGGSLLTDKTGVEALRQDVLARVAEDIASARAADASLRLVLGHGSGSFGHVAAAQYGTRNGAATPEQWRGFAIVSDAAARLNRAVVAALLAAGVPAVSFPPSAAVRCRDGQIVSQTLAAPVTAALAAGLIPVIYGDVAFDETRGGTIVSTEEVMMSLATDLSPAWLLLAGETAGVYDAAGDVIPAITPETLAAVLPALGGSRGTDVTGGMAAKVVQMLDLTAAQPGLRVRIFSGLEAGALAAVLGRPDYTVGTVLQQT